MARAIRIDPFLDGEGKITQLPQKQNVKYALLAYLAAKFDLRVDYTERQVNDICERWHTFGDYFLLRRELIDNGLMNRERDGSRYWRVDIPSPSDAACSQIAERRIINQDGASASPHADG